jgi:hypothetical protein
MERVMDMKHEDLTAGERRYLEHARAAKSQGISLPQYYRANGLSVFTLYNIRRGLIRKGVVARARAQRISRAKSGGFVAVRVASSDPPATGITASNRSSILRQAERRGSSTTMLAALRRAPTCSRW